LTNSALGDSLVEVRAQRQLARDDRDDSAVLDAGFGHRHRRPASTLP
jgi:hypothetical protein